MIHDDLGRRMKEFYESVPKTKLIRRMPVIIRIDGKAFHTFTRGMKKPFDAVLIGSMQDTMKYLCENIQGCVIGYQQSDEISLALVDYRDLNSSAWFDYEVQKMSSISASMATLAFNKAFNKRYQEYLYNIEKRDELDENIEYIMAYKKASENGAMFDARCFNLPKEEVVNYFLWRQLDAIRNSVETVGHAYFKQPELHKKNNEQIKAMLKEQRGIDWEEYASDCKRGCCCKKTQSREEREGQAVVRNKWEIDHNIPVFKGGDRKYINEKILYAEN